MKKRIIAFIINFISKIILFIIISITKVILFLFLTLFIFVENYLQK
jgi:hypothetical protein